MERLDNSLDSWMDKKYIVILNELFSRTIYPKYKKSWIRFVKLMEKKLKNAAGADASEIAKKIELLHLKSDNGSSKPTSADFSKLSNVVEKQVFRKTVCNVFF